jgi:hypothetical protein
MRNLRLVHSTSWFERPGTGSTTRHDPERGGEPLTALERRWGEIERALPAMDPTVQAMVEHVRIIAPLPRAVRARALARARAAIAALG